MFLLDNGFLNEQNKLKGINELIIIVFSIMSVKLSFQNSQIWQCKGQILSTVILSLNNLMCVINEMTWSLVWFLPVTSVSG